MSKKKEGRRATNSCIFRQYKRKSTSMTTVTENFLHKRFPSPLQSSAYGYKKKGESLKQNGKNSSGASLQPGNPSSHWHMTQHMWNGATTVADDERGDPPRTLCALSRAHTFAKRCIFGLTHLLAA